MRRLRFLLLICLILPAAALAERPRAGLMWNRSGLPATFPLQIISPAGRDYVVHLLDAGTDRAVMAGYVHGGGPFRLLVPPGRYRLRIAHGLGWIDETRMFGPGTAWIESPQVLDFRVIGTSRRSGYLVRLELQGGEVRLADLRPQPWCQIASWRMSRDDRPEAGELPLPPDMPERLWPRDPDWQLRIRSRPCV